MKSNGNMLQRINRRFPQLKWVLPRPVKRFILVRFGGVRRGYEAPPSRIWLEREVLPRLPKLGFRKILFVGAAPYTHHYEKLVCQAGGVWVTADVNPGAAVWGAREHIEAPIQGIDRRCPPDSFEAVILNGVFGFGVNTVPEMNRSIGAIKRILTPTGLLLLGWNTDLMADPLLLEQLQADFRLARGLPFPVRREFAGETHVYDFLVCYPALGGTASL